MTLTLHFWASSREHAERQALEWADAEPFVASATVEGTEMIAEPVGAIAGRWHVTVDLTLRSGTQEVLGL